MRPVAGQSRDPGVVGSPARFQATKPPSRSVTAVRPTSEQAGRGEAGGVALLADDHHRSIGILGLGEAVGAAGVEAPLQVVALDDEGAGNLAELGPLGRRADVDQQAAVVARSAWPGAGPPGAGRGAPARAGGRLRSRGPASDRRGTRRAPPPGRGAPGGRRSWIPWGESRRARWSPGRPARSPRRGRSGGRRPRHHRPRCSGGRGSVPERT